jgi:hypothetical protein
MQLLQILNKASKEELNGLAKILGVEEKVTATPSNLEKELLSNDSLLGNIFNNKEEKYSKLVRKTAKKSKSKECSQLFCRRSGNENSSKSIRKNVGQNESRSKKRFRKRA